MPPGSLAYRPMRPLGSLPAPIPAASRLSMTSATVCRAGTGVGTGAATTACVKPWLIGAWTASPL